MSDVNPGELLRNYLVDLYPVTSLGFLQKIDYDMAADGQIVSYAYMSSINYVVRRLVTLAGFYYRKYPPEEYGTKCNREIEKYLSEFMRFNDTQVEEIVKLLIKCVKATNDSYTSKQRDKVIRQARNYRYHCHTCGTDLEFEDDMSWSYATADHRWPKSIGGLSVIDNLDAVCRSCNNELKGSYIDASDYHYEEMSLVSANYDSFIDDRDRQYELAIFAKTDFKCGVCEAPAHRVGSLRVGRIEPKDSWHFLNLQGYCSRHVPKTDL